MTLHKSLGRQAKTSTVIWNFFAKVRREKLWVAAHHIFWLVGRNMMNGSESVSVVITLQSRCFQPSCEHYRHLVWQKFFNDYLKGRHIKCRETRHNLIAHHGVSLPRACLAIGKHTCIDTFKCSFEDIRAQIFIDLKLEKKSHMILMYAKTGKSKHQGKPIKK